MSCIAVGLREASRTLQQGRQREHSLYPWFADSLLQ